MGITKHVRTALPAFESPLLKAVVEALERRSKALRHQAKSFSITRELEATPEESERLSIDAETLEARPTQIRLSILPDGAVWFRACQPAKQGWAFLFAFQGRLKTSEQQDVTSWLEHSLDLVHGATRESDCAEDLLSLWHPVSPVVSHDAQQGDTADRPRPAGPTGG